jgi:hypothetical protein
MAVSVVLISEARGDNQHRHYHDAGNEVDDRLNRVGKQTHQLRYEAGRDWIDYTWFVAAC